MLAELVDALRIIFGIAFLFFVPGYALVWAIYPRRDALQMDERIALAFVLSVTADVLVTLFIDLVLGLPTTGWNIFVSLLALTAAAACLQRLQVYWHSRRSTA